MRHVPGSVTVLAAALLTASLAACQRGAPAAQPGAATPTAQTAPDAAADVKFADLSKRWLDGWMQLNPVAATQIGDHRFDAELDDTSAAGRQKLVDFSRKLLPNSMPWTPRGCRAKTRSMR